MPCALLHTYNEKQVAFWIDGYFSLTPGDATRNTPAKEFEHARAVAVAAMQRHVDELKAMSFEKWSKLTECRCAKPPEPADTTRP